MERDDERMQRIRERAYALWERGDPRHAAEHWLEAERQIDAEDAPPTKAASKARKAAKKVAKKKSAEAAAAEVTAKRKAAKTQPKKFCAISFP